MAFLQGLMECFEIFCAPLFIFLVYFIVLFPCIGGSLVSINVIVLHLARLVPGLVMVLRWVNHLGV